MSRLKDETGRRYDRLVVISFAGSNGRALWKCRCDCGNERIVKGINLRRYGSTSCGCKTLRHGHSSKRDVSPTYISWRAMRSRCYNPSLKCFSRYGGRGIQVCARWSRFENFLADMGERPPGKTIDRIDLNGHYMPSNCRWVTPQQNSWNRRRRGDGITGWKGVSFSHGKFCALIMKDGKQVFLGYFKTAEEAAKVYDEAAKLCFGEFARLNFADAQE